MHKGTRHKGTSYGYRALGRQKQLKEHSDFQRFHWATSWMLTSDTLWEYDTENYNEESNHTETPLEPHWKALLKIITLKFVCHCYSRMLTPYNPTETYWNNFQCYSYPYSLNLNNYSGFQCDFQCHILIVTIHAHANLVHDLTRVKYFSFAMSPDKIAGTLNAP